MDTADDTRSGSATASNLNRGTASAIHGSPALSRGFRPLLVNMIRKLISPDKGKKSSEFNFSRTTTCPVCGNPRHSMSHVWGMPIDSLEKLILGRVRLSVFN